MDIFSLERKFNMNKIKTALWILNTLLLLMPLVLIGIFVNKSSLSCIDKTNKIYMILITLAILTYWAVEYVKRNEK